ncbi:MAG: efflux RND transporter periplasmic adaptor subunit [Rikenellaceae bacterium]
MKHLLFILSLIVVVCSCGSQSSVQQKTVTVKVDTVRLYGAEPFTEYSGRVKASQDINLAFRVSGTILETYFKEGQFVSKGQTLVQMDQRDYAIQLNATEAEYKQIKGEAERVIELYERNSVSKSDYEKAVYGLQQITAKYEAHKNALADTRLVAPFDGYVSKYRYQAGETVAAGYPVVSMYNNDTPEVEIYIPKDEYDKRDKFASFECGVGEDNAALSLISISPKANLNQLYSVLLKVSSLSEAMPAVGSIATIRVKYVSNEKSEIVVPTSSLFKRENKSYVWIYNNGSVSSREVFPVTVYTDGFVSVEGDVSSGEIVVSGGVRSLEEKQAVRPLKPRSQTNIGGLL